MYSILLLVSGIIIMATPENKHCVSQGNTLGVTGVVWAVVVFLIMFF